MALGNLSYGVDNGSALTPYVGAGGGYGWTSGEGGGNDVGVAFALSHCG